MKGERPSEMVGIARAMRAHAVKLPARFAPLLDLCGTGGDRAGTFNISSVAAVVAAASGVRVAKHGNRAVSSTCGSADLFEALGVCTTAPADVVARCLEQAGIAFLFAPVFHPSMRHAAPVRRELGLRTAFNLLGPLTNPASPTHQLVGVPRPELTELVARSLLALGSERAWVVHGADGLDEISTTGHSKVSECRGGTVSTFYVHPSDFGLPVTTREALAGGSVEANAGIAKAVLGGARGPARDVVALNAGAALFIAGRAASVSDGIALAAAAIDSGAALRTLENLARLSHSGEGTVLP
jgi:anthranilate phosphoribosyltransferase